MQAIRRLFGGTRPAVERGRRLYAAASAQARQPAFYAEAGVPDTPTGRFELYTLHVVLVLHRLKGQGTEAAETAQALFDAYVKSLDHALRELGVGDLSVGKKMRRLGEAIYGRVKNYDDAFGQLPETQALEALIGRTVFAGVDGGDVRGLTGYAAAAVAALAAQPLEQIYGAAPAWPALVTAGGTR